MAFGFFIPDVSLFASFSVWRKISLISAELYVMHHAHFPVPHPSFIWKSMCPPPDFLPIYLTQTLSRSQACHTHFFLFYFWTVKIFTYCSFEKDWQLQAALVKIRNASKVLLLRPVMKILTIEVPYLIKLNSVACLENISKIFVFWL